MTNKENIEGKFLSTLHNKDNWTSNDLLLPNLVAQECITVLENSLGEFGIWCNYEGWEYNFKHFIWCSSTSNESCTTEQLVTLFMNREAEK